MLNFLACFNDLFNFWSIFVTLLSCYLIWHFWNYGDNSPGPYIWPFVGCLPQILLHLGRMYDWSVDLLQKCPKNTFFSTTLGLNEVVTADPEIVEYVLKTNFQNFPKGPDFQENFRDLLGHGIFNSDDEVWKSQRKTASLEFSARSLRDLTVNSVHKEITQRLLPTLSKAMESGTEIDIQDVMLRYTFDNICRVGFGVDPGCLGPDLPYIPFANAFDTATGATLLRNMIPSVVWKLCRYFRWGSEQKLAESVQKIDKFALDVIKRRRQELQAKKNAASEAEVEREASEDEHTDLLSRFMLLSEQDGGQLYSDTFLRDACTNFILAGRDTSAVALSWLFWLLTWHPEVEKKILDEIQQILDLRKANRENVEDKTFSYNELKRMNYLHSAITEALRLYPSVPADTKYVLKDDKLPNGMLVRKGWRVTYLPYAMGRMTKVWGNDAKEFKPERWIGNDGSFRSESPFKFIAFNAGPRLCLGRDMAFVQMKSVASSVLREFKLKLVPGHPIAYTMSLTLFMKYGLKMTVHKR